MSNSIKSDETEKSYSLNGEDFCFDDLRDVVDKLVDDGVEPLGATYYEADFRRISSADLISSDSIIESVDDQLFDIVGEGVDMCLDLGDEAKKELEDFLANWLNKHASISHLYTIVGKSRRMQITKDDLEFLEEAPDESWKSWKRGDVLECIDDDTSAEVGRFPVVLALHLSDGDVILEGMPLVQFDPAKFRLATRCASCGKPIPICPPYPPDETLCDECSNEVGEMIKRGEL